MSAPLAAPELLGLDRDAARAHAEGRFADAAALWQRRLDAAAARGLPRPAVVLACLAHARLGMGDTAGAEAGYRDALAEAEAQRDPDGLVAAWSGLAYALQARGDFEPAAAAFERAAGLLERARAAADAGWTRVAAGGARYLGGDLPGARRAFESGLALLRGRAADADVAGALTGLGGVLLAADEPRDALAALDEALARLGAAAGDGTPREGALRLNRGLAALAVGALDGAAADLERARDVFLAGDDRLGAAQALASLSDLRRFRGDIAGAIACHEAVLALDAGHRSYVRGGRLRAPIVDRSLHLEVAGTAPPTADAGPPPPAPGPAAAVALPPPRRAPGDRPFVLFAPPCTGLRGPLFPRGATSVTSFLVHHGVPSVVVPLSEAVDGFVGSDGAAARHARLRAAVEDALASLRPRAVGVSVPFTHLYGEGQEIARLAREAAPDVPILVGGPHVTFQDEVCLAETPAVDVVVRGEGEWTALAVLRALAAGADLDGVAGITWRARDGRIRQNPDRPLGDLRELPDVDFGLLPAAFARRMEVTGLTSRGCRFRCRYCHEQRFWGGVVRRYPIERVTGEIERLARDHGNPMRGIDDSMLSLADPWFADLCAALGRCRARPDGFGLLTRADTITREGLAAMRAAGLRSLSVGLESGSPRVLQAMGKRLTPARARAGLELARDAGVSVAAFLMVGHPGDDPTETEKTLAWVDGLFGEDLLGWIDPATFTPYPGTPFFDRPERHGVRILTRDWSRWRRTDRPVAELTDYPADAIWLGFLRLLAVVDRHCR